MDALTTIATPFADDRAALRAVAEQGAGLCTIVGIEGSFSRRLGAQLAVHGDGAVTGSLADGCLENQLATEILSGGERRVMRFGAGSPLIDFRLPCGGGLDILIDPAPDRAAARAALDRLDARAPASLALPVPAGSQLLAERRFIPPLRLVLFGEGPELEALAGIGAAAGLVVETHGKDGPADNGVGGPASARAPSSPLALGQRPEIAAADPWSAVVLLFHDHEWEQALLEWALASPAFYVGAQGGRAAREKRLVRLVEAGFDAGTIARVKSPVGVIRHSREPVALALSALAQIVGGYEALHPHS